MKKHTNKPSLLLPAVLLGVALLIAGYVSVAIISSARTKGAAQPPSGIATSTITPSPTKTLSRPPRPSVTMPPQTLRTYDWGTYKSCTVYSRKNMNTYNTNINMLDEESQIRCSDAGGEKIMVSVADKKGHSVAHSIYRFWKDSDGYKLLVVDQNGAGSGEGHGKILELFNDSAVLLSCFYFISDDFITVNVPIEWGTPLSMSEMATVQKNLINSDNQYCRNFTLTSSVR